MTRRQPDGKHIHAAGERDHGIVGDSQNDQARPTQAAQMVPDGIASKGWR